MAEIGWEDWKGIDLAHDTDMQQPVVNILVKIEFHTVQVIFCMAEELLAAKGRICSIELVGYLERCSFLQLTLRYNCHIFSGKCLSLKLYTLITVRWPHPFIIRAFMLRSVSILSVWSPPKKLTSLQHSRK
jgi:hypothetical protein